MDAFYQKLKPSGRRWRVQAPRTRAAERFRATGGRTGELRQDWHGAFVVIHIGRAGLIVQGTH